jgi:ribosomal protein S18 acetylase RimI-like enzyme
VTPTPDDALQIVDLRDSRDEGLLREIYGGLYERSFPFEDEREDLDFWRENLWNGQPGSLVVHFLVAGRALGDPAARRVAGFIGSEYYPRSRVGLVTYIGVDPDWREGGVGRALMDAAYRALGNDARAGGTSLRAIFAEIHEPTRIEPNTDSIAPRDRVAIMGRYGGRRVPIPYVQPALGEGQERAYGLMLVAFPRRRRDFARRRGVGAVPAEPVRDFLDELYEASEGTTKETRRNDRDFARMLDALHGHVELEDLLSEEGAEPAFPFERYGIAFHLAFWRSDDAGAPHELDPSDVEIDSFERDVLAYAYRDVRPFTTQVDLRPWMHQLRLRFPRQVSFVTEGHPVTLLRNDGADDGERHVSLRIARTDFRSGVSILHLVLGPAQGRGPSTLGEYEIIKLVKFWEGGEGVHEPSVEVTDSALFTVAGTSADGETTLLAIARDVADDCGNLERLPLRAGTVQAVIDDAPCLRLCDAVRRLKEHEGAARMDEETCRRITAVGGILQGLFDFEEVDLDELADVFKDIDPETSRIDSIKKGTLFSLTHLDRGFDAAETIGISPYLLIPHAVLLHNEELLQRAARVAAGEQVASGVSLEGSWKDTPGRWWARAPRAGWAWASGRWKHRLTRTESDRRMIAGLLNDLVPNVFHYEAEQQLYKRGWESRGLESLKNDVENRLAELDTDIDKRHSRLRDIAAQIIALLLLVFTAVQATDYLPTAIVVTVSIVTALVYLSLILRR